MRILLPPQNNLFQMNNSGSFHISAQNIDCGYSLEPSRQGGSNEYHDLVLDEAVLTSTHNLYFEQK